MEVINFNGKKYVDKASYDKLAAEKSTEKPKKDKKQGGDVDGGYIGQDLTQ